MLSGNRSTHESVSGQTGFTPMEVLLSKAVRFDRYGAADVLELVDIPDRSPGSSEVRVRVVTAGINPGEMAIREGALHEMFPTTFPSGEGSDFAGVIVEVGDHVDGV